MLQEEIDETVNFTEVFNIWIRTFLPLDTFPRTCSPGHFPAIFLSVRLSVRNAPVSDENGSTYCHSFFSPYGNPIILVLPASNIFIKFRGVTRCGGAKYRWGIKISRFSTNKSLFLANDTRYRHSYYGR